MNTNFTPSSNWNNHINNRKPYGYRGATYLGDLEFQLPREEQNVSSTAFALPKFQLPPNASDLNGREKLVQQMNEDNRKSLDPLANENDKNKIQYNFTHPRSGISLEGFNIKKTSLELDGMIQQTKKMQSETNNMLNEVDSSIFN